MNPKGSADNGSNGSMGHGHVFLIWVDSPNNNSSITSKMPHRPGVAGSTKRVLSGESVKYINCLDYKEKEKFRIRETKHL